MRRCRARRTARSLADAPDAVGRGTARRGAARASLGLVPLPLPEEPGSSPLRLPLGFLSGRMQPRPAWHTCAIRNRAAGVSAALPGRRPRQPGCLLGGGSGRQALAAAGRADCRRAGGRRRPARHPPTVGRQVLVFTPACWPSPAVLPTPACWPSPAWRCRHARWLLPRGRVRAGCSPVPMARGSGARGPARALAGAALGSLGAGRLGLPAPVCAVCHALAWRSSRGRLSIRPSCARPPSDLAAVTTPCALLAGFILALGGGNWDGNPPW